jgi:hypothetical protein
MDRVGKSLGVHSMEDWYKISKDDIISFGGTVFSCPQESGLSFHFSNLVFS